MATRRSALEPPIAFHEDEEPPASCPYCDRPFSDVRARDLHMGEQHEADLDDVERAAYEEAAEAERDELFFFHIRIVVTLGLLYSSTVILYMVAIQSGIL